MFEFALLVKVGAGWCARRLARSLAALLVLVRHYIHIDMALIALLSHVPGVVRSLADRVFVTNAVQPPAVVAYNVRLFALESVLSCAPQPASHGTCRLAPRRPACSR